MVIRLARTGAGRNCSVKRFQYAIALSSSGVGGLEDSSTVRVAVELSGSMHGAGSEGIGWRHEGLDHQLFPDVVDRRSGKLEIPGDVACQTGASGLAGGDASITEGCSLEWITGLNLFDFTLRRTRAAVSVVSVEEVTRSSGLIADGVETQRRRSADTLAGNRSFCEESRQSPHVEPRLLAPPEVDGVQSSGPVVAEQTVDHLNPEEHRSDLHGLTVVGVLDRTHRDDAANGKVRRSVRMVIPGCRDQLTDQLIVWLVLAQGVLQI